MKDILARLFGRVYWIKLTSSDNTLRHNSFRKGTAWGAVQYGAELADKKTDAKEEGKVWALDRIIKL